MAVDEAWAMLARIATSDAAHNPTQRCRFTVWAERIEVATEVDVDDVADLLPPGSFGWRVLECLTDEVSVLVLPGEPGQPGRVCIVLVKRPVTAHQS
jgi:serine/threonine-protein kinase RsbW